MNLDQRYRCAAHSNITVGATRGETEAPSCPICRQQMTLIAPSTPAAPRQKPANDQRVQMPPRGESRPL